MIKRITLTIIFFILFSSYLIAETFTFIGSDGQPISFEITNPDVISIIEDYTEEIQEAITENDVKSTDVTEDVQKYITDYENSDEVKQITQLLSDPTSSSSFGTNGAEGFASSLIDALQGSATSQNQWAQAYIGQLFPGFHLGFGINAGIGLVDLSSLASMAESFDTELPVSTLPFPSITADFRMGGIILPFDFGLSLMKVDTSKIDAISSIVEGIALDYFVFGADIRYALLKNGPLNSRLSVTGGFYYTSMGFTYKTDSLELGANINVGTIALGAQASCKILFLVPYFGARVVTSFGSTGIYVAPDWTSLLGDDSNSKLLAKLMPKKIEIGSQANLMDYIRPQVFAGFGIDLLIVDITAGFSYTFISNIIGFQASVRLAWN